MKRTEKHMAKGLLYKHFDLERKYAKQAEARLSQRLQSLEDICLYHMKWLTREQRQLQKELQRLQQEITKKKFSSCFGNGNQEKPKDAYVFPPQDGQKHRALQPNKLRALPTNMPQEICKTKSQMPSFHPTGMKVSKRSKDRSLSQNCRAAGFTEEKPQVPEKASINPPKGVDSKRNTSILCQGQEVSTDTLDQGRGSSPAGDNGMTHGDESRSTDDTLKPDQDAGKQITWNPMEQARNFKAEPTKATYLELFEKARHAHYIRHRAPPESERLLSTGEIFGHEESLQSREAKECENRLTI
ncbi:coiled-coil domain-containing protein 190 isoform X2 [Dasypus novemcinctus]|uniref:coiled-coil domain-containing protein 190 isoform X2 n=1 Tax=Dasypus novemcinctus TaxID=9361 RepID=UPI00265E1CCD|nr:coiled-coil domain-containing protein 190 isoform X2 [Dasypus novemcinctus]